FIHVVFITGENIMARLRLYVHRFDTGFGPMTIAATDDGIALIGLPGVTPDHFEKIVDRDYRDHDRLSGDEDTAEAERQLLAYFGGQLTKFSLRLDIHGTPFQKKVLREVALIPFGKVMTYAEVAGAVGHPRAYRAIGSVMAFNRLPLVIPCHRVVGAGGLGGYAGGPDLKRRLLRHEGVAI
ncbi:MAG: methylated-DNA--[protein]-cysteine S-methyltransferase, partial [Candidatus Zixiibacteriota bacterium]